MAKKLTAKQKAIAWGRKRSKVVRRRKTRRNPADATFRNIRALKKRVAALEKDMDRLLKALR